MPPPCRPRTGPDEGTGEMSSDSEAPADVAGALSPDIEALLLETESAAAALGRAAERREWAAAGAHDAALARAVAALGAALARAEPHVLRAAAERLGAVQALHGAALESLRRTHAEMHAELQAIAQGRRAAASYLAVQEQDGTLR